jgi:hypothetical protein
VAGEPGASVVVELIVTVAAEPAGMPKSNTAALSDPLLTTVADEPGLSVVVVPALTVAAAPVAPVSPLGMVKSNTAALVLPVFTTRALDPDTPVVVVPTLIVAAAPAGPVAPVAPVSPRGIVKSNTAALLVPLLTTLAFDPETPVVVVPTFTVAAAPGVPTATQLEPSHTYMPVVSIS